MTDDVFCPYRLDRPLTAEEQAFFAHLPDTPAGAAVNRGLAALGIEVVGEDERKSLQIDREASTAEAVVSFYRQVLDPYVINLPSEQAAEALGGAGMALRVGLAVLGERHELVLESLADSATFLGRLGREEEALPRHETALTAYREVLGAEHPETLIVLHNSGRCLMALGRRAEALEQFRACYDGQCRTHGAHDRRKLASLSGIAECLSELGRWNEAVEAYRMLYEQRRAVFGERDPETLSSLDQLGYYLRATGRYQEAMEKHRAAHEGRLAIGARADAYASLHNCAFCSFELGQYAEALHLLEEAYKVYAEELGEGHRWTLTNLNDQASCLTRLGQYERGATLLRRLYPASAEALGEDDVQTVRCLFNLAACLEQLGRAGDALPHYKRTLAVEERVLGPEHPDTLRSRNNLAHCLQALGRAGEALPEYEATLAVSERLLGPEHPDTLGSRHDLAHCLAALGRASEALPRYEETLAAYQRVLGPEHPHTLISRHNLAFCLHALGRWEESGAQWRAQARALQGRPQPGGTWLELLGHCANALAVYARAGRLTDWDVLFAGLSTSLRTVIDLEAPEQLAASRAGVAQFYSTYLGLCIDLDRRERIPQVLAARQGRKLAALVLEELEAAGEALDPQSLRGRFQALRLALRQLALGLRVVEGSEGMGSGEGGQRLLDADSAIARQRTQLAAYKAKLAEYRALRTELEASDPDFAVGAAALAPRFEDLQARLGAEEGLLLLFERPGEGTGDTPGNTTRLALLITATHSALIPLRDPPLDWSTGLALTWRGRGWVRAGLRDAVATSAIEAATEASADPSAAPTAAGTEPQAERRTEDLAAALQAGLWEPLAEPLTGLTELHVVTHGRWHLLPVELGAPPSLTLAAYPGFIYYHRLRHQGAAAGPVVPAAEQALGVAIHAAFDSPGLEPIPFVQAEADLISALWPGPVHREPDLGAERPVLSALQLAAHGQLDGRDPARANLLLRDRTLDFHAVLQARQHPPVVVLAACTVGRTTEDPDGEPLGLVGSFLLKGSRYVIAALQPVPDFYMPLLMALFYQSWSRTQTPAAALAEAKRRLQTGAWYEDTEAQLRTHYRPILVSALAAAHSRSHSNQDPVQLLTHAWPFPAPYRALDVDADQHTLDALRERLATAQGCAELAEGILDTLVAEREHLPVTVIDTLCTWVRGFGVTTDAA